MGPEADKSASGVRVTGDESLLVGIHGAFDDGCIPSADTLHIDAYRPVSDSYSQGVAAMTDREVRTMFHIGFAFGGEEPCSTRAT